jgi:predicted nucleic acid-binding protein
LDRVFLDASVLFSAAYRATSPLRRFWELPDTELCTSEYALGEARRNLLEKRPAQVLDLEKLVDSVTILPTPTDAAALPAEVALPEKDRPILRAATQARASHLVTGDDAHFGPYFGQTIGGVLILPPSDYLESRSPAT